MQNFIQIGLGVSVLRMRDFAPPSDSATFLGFLRKATAETRAPIFDAKYVKRRGSAQGSAFWGLRNQNLRFRPPFPPKTAIFVPHFDGTVFSPENGFYIGRLESKRPLIVVVAQ